MVIRQSQLASLHIEELPLSPQKSFTNTLRPLDNEEAHDRLVGSESV